MLQHVELFVGIIPRQQIHLTEDLEGVNEREDRYKHHRRREIPQLDGEELVQLRRALHVRDFQQLLRDVRQARHEQDHVVAQVLPQEEQHDHPLAVVALQPVDLLPAEEHHKLVHGAVVVEQHLPDQHHRGHRHHHRAQEEGPELALQRDSRLQHQRHQDRQHHRQRHRDH